MVFYLKINREENYTYRNLQHWINTIELIADATIYLLCDKKTLKEEIIRKVNFKNKKVEFIESCKASEELSYIVSNVTNDYWRNAGYAHLTTFWHAKKNNIKKFWNIDGDDTYFCLEPGRICEMLDLAEKCADKNRIKAFSLDMWRTREKGRHWSFGITYIDNSVDWIGIMKQHCSDMELKSDRKQPKNADGFFTYLKKHTDLKIETFYVENLRFIHYSDDFFKRPIASGLFHWKQGSLCFPIVYYCFNLKQLGLLPIEGDIIQLDINISDQESELFLRNDAIEKELIQKYSNM